MKQAWHQRYTNLLMQSLYYVLDYRLGQDYGPYDIAKGTHDGITKSVTHLHTAAPLAISNQSPLACPTPISQPLKRRTPLPSLSLRLPTSSLPHSGSPTPSPSPFHLAPLNPHPAPPAPQSHTDTPLPQPTPHAPSQPPHRSALPSPTSLSPCPPPHQTDKRSSASHQGRDVSWRRGGCGEGSVHF